MENARFELPSSKEHWMDFLVFMGAHHKRPLDEQILAFVQKPDAKALAEYDWWNDHRRWIKRGSKGFGLLREVNGSMPLMVKRGTYYEKIAYLLHSTFRHCG